MPEEKGVGAAGHCAHRLVMTPHSGPVAGDVTRRGLETDEGSLRSLLLDLGERVAADELAFLGPNGPAEARLVRIHAQVHVVAVETERRLETRGVACPKSGRENPIRGTL